MAKARISITNPTAKFHSGSDTDFFKAFAENINSVDKLRYWKHEEGVASYGNDYEISQNEIRDYSKADEPQTIIGGQFKFNKQKPPKYNLNLKGSVSSYTRKLQTVGSLHAADDSFSTIKATGLRRIKIHKLIKKNIDQFGRYTGKSFLEDAIIGTQKNLDVIINDPHINLPPRDIGKTKYSLVGEFENENHFPSEWKLSLGNSKEFIDLSRFGDERVKINNFDPKNDSIAVDGDFYTRENILYIETPNGSYRNIASFTTNDNPTLTETTQEITENYNIRSI